MKKLQIFTIVSLVGLGWLLTGFEALNLVDQAGRRGSRSNRHPIDLDQYIQHRGYPSNPKPRKPATGLNQRPHSPVNRTPSVPIWPNNRSNGSGQRGSLNYH